MYVCLYVCMTTYLETTTYLYVAFLLSPCNFVIDLECCSLSQTRGKHLARFHGDVDDIEGLTRYHPEDLGSTVREKLKHYIFGNLY
jgi:poly-beta-hydroxyalkanoate depolymerase